MKTLGSGASCALGLPQDCASTSGLGALGEVLPRSPLHRWGAAHIPPSPVLDQDLSPGHQAQTPATWAYLNFSESDSVPLSQASRVAAVGSEVDRVHRHRKSQGQCCSGLSALLQSPMTC